MLSTCHVAAGTVCHGKCGCGLCSARAQRTKGSQARALMAAPHANIVSLRAAALSTPRLHHGDLLVPIAMPRRHSLPLPCHPCPNPCRASRHPPRPAHPAPHPARSLLPVHAYACPMLTYHSMVEQNVLATKQQPLATGGVNTTLMACNDSHQRTHWDGVIKCITNWFAHLFGI